MAGRLEVIDELYAPALARGGEGVDRALPGIVSRRPHGDDRAHRRGRHVVGRFTCSGTHLGDWLGYAPTGRRFEAVDEVGIYRFRDGRIVETWGLEDNLGRLEQLGLR